MQPIPETHRVPGNKECEGTLLEALENVRKGRIKYLGLVMCESPTHVEMVYSGAVGCEFAAAWGYDMLKQALMRPQSRGPEDQQSAVEEVFGDDFVCYDLHRAPLSYDFSSWLVFMEMRRIKAGAPAPLKVAFTKPPPDRQWTAYSDLMLKEVLVPMVEMIGGVVDSRALKARNRVEYYCPFPIVEAAKEGAAVPRLKPRPQLVEACAQVMPVPPVTITLREAEHDPFRNSNLEAWLKFAQDLKDAGEHVVIVRDTLKADELLAGFETFPQASKDLHIRCALYNYAKANLFVSNGPFGLALFGECPWLYLNDISEYPGTVNGREMWERYIGVEVGGQYPWARPDQRIVWKHDDYENIVAAWKEYAPVLNQAKAA